MVTKSVEIDPFKYWRRIIYLFFAFLIVSVSVSIVLVYLADKDLLVNKGSREKVESLTPQTLREKELTQLVKIFGEREEFRASLLTDKEFMTDPASYSALTSTNISN